MPHRRCANCARTFVVLAAAARRRYCSTACYEAATASLPDHPEREFHVFADGLPEPAWVTAELRPPRLPWEPEPSKSGLDWLDDWQR